jgi:hypothetical protein
MWLLGSTHEISHSQLCAVSTAVRFLQIPNIIVSTPAENDQQIRSAEVKLNEIRGLLQHVFTSDNFFLDKKRQWAISFRRYQLEAALTG